MAGDDYSRVGGDIKSFAGLVLNVLDLFDNEKRQ